MTPGFQWPGFVPWKKPKKLGGYTARHPTHYDFRPDVEEVAREIVERFDVSVNTYHKHPPFTRKNWERVSLDVWGPRGRADALDPEVGRQVWSYLWNRPGIRWQWGIYLGRRWTRGRGWDRKLIGPPGSDPRHRRHIHLSYEL